MLGYTALCWIDSRLHLHLLEAGESLPINSLIIDWLEKEMNVDNMDNRSMMMMMMKVSMLLSDSIVELKEIIILREK